MKKQRGFDRVVFLTFFLGDSLYNQTITKDEVPPMTVIYIDRVFLLNGIVDYLLLLSTAGLAGVPFRRRRLLLCAVGGGLYAVAVFLPGCTLLAYPAAKLLSGFLMALAAFGCESRRWRLILLFFLLSGGLAGILLAVGLMLGSPGELWSRVYRASINWRVFLLSTLGFAVVLRIVFRQAARHTGKRGNLLPVDLLLEGRQVHMTALHDTGNTLRDPLYGTPVLVAEKTAAANLWPTEIQRVLKEHLPPEEQLLLLERFSQRFRLIPFQSVGVAGGLLLAARSDLIRVNGKEYPRILVALSDTPLSTGGHYQALWGEAEEKKAYEKVDSQHLSVADAPVPTGTGDVYRRQ